MKIENKNLLKNIESKQTELDLRPIIELKELKKEIIKDDKEGEIDLSSLSEEELKKLKEEDPITYYSLLEKEAQQKEIEYPIEIINRHDFIIEEEPFVDLGEETKTPKKEENLSLKEKEERKKAADKYHVLNPTTIYKGAHGVWKFIKDDSSVEEWDQLMSENDNRQLYK